MTDYFTLAAGLARSHHPAAETRGLLMAEPKRSTTPKPLNTVKFAPTDEDLDVLIEALRIASQSVRDEEISARFISDSHREYLRRWVEKFDDVRERLEKG